ncbi:MAG: membrane protein insertase YidC, partial [Chlorobiaceae bacterium]
MDRNSITGLAIIAVIMMVWLQFMSPANKPLQPAKVVNTEQVEQQTQSNRSLFSEPAAENYGVFASASEGKEQLLKVENDLFRATLSSKGATLKSLVLKKHLDGDRKAFDLVSNQKNGALSLLFLTREGKKIDTRDLYFRSMTVDTLHT